MSYYKVVTKICYNLRNNILVFNKISIWNRICINHGVYRISINMVDMMNYKSNRILSKCIVRDDEKLL